MTLRHFIDERHRAFRWEMEHLYKYGDKRSEGRRVLISELQGTEAICNEPVWKHHYRIRMPKGGIVKPVIMDGSASVLGLFRSFHYIQS
ncbi:MAG: hypothetical protein EA359_02765 [Balneolaceae bacterium]|nr:MAG: hypothetical protein EA359_02765 [Balneolaceae bacterium]